MNLPQGSLIARYLPHAYFTDRWTVKVPTRNVSAMTLYIESMRRMPRWANGLMRVRNVLWGLLGVKDLGLFGDILRLKHPCDYLAGDRAGIFTVVSNERDEVVMEDCDRHLDVRVSIHIMALDRSGYSQVAVTTIVHVHNWLGRVYMVPVYPLHKLILWYSMRQIKILLKSNSLLPVQD